MTCEPLLNVADYARCAFSALSKGVLDYYEGGNIGKTAAFSLVQTVLLGVLIGFANWLSRGAAQTSVGRTG